mgnify:CR=1 FL=1
MDTFIQAAKKKFLIFSIQKFLGKYYCTMYIFIIQSSKLYIHSYKQFEKYRIHDTCIDKFEYCTKDLRLRLILETQKLPFSERQLFSRKSESMSKVSNVNS